MKKRLRLRRRTDFQRAMAGGRVYAARALVAFAVPSPAGQPHSRIGVTVSRRVRGAVARNRARRRVREAARLYFAADDSRPHEVGINLDMVLIARPEALTIGFDELRREVVGAARKGIARAGAP